MITNGKSSILESIQTATQLPARPSAVLLATTFSTRLSTTPPVARLAGTAKSPRPSGKHHLRGNPFANYINVALNSGSPAVASKYQICGSNMYANRFPLPPRVACTTTPATPTIVTQTRLYTEQLPTARMNAKKCYRDSLAIPLVDRKSVV